MKNMTRVLLGAVLWGLATLTWAQVATVQSVKGEVQVQSAAGTTPLAAGQTIPAGAQLVTGANGQAVLRFNDGHIVALKDNTTLNLTAYTYSQQQPASSSFIMNLVKGGLRSITGLLGKSNPQSFKLYAATATIGIRGTDFLVAIVDGNVYATVTEGSVTVTGAGGSVTTLTAGQFVVVSPSGAVTPISAAQVPASAFGNLQSISVSGTAAGTSGAAGGAGGATGGVAGTGVSMGGVVAATVGGLTIAAQAAAVAASTNNSQPGATGTVAPPTQSAQ